MKHIKYFIFFFLSGCATIFDIVPKNINKNFNYGHIGDKYVSGIYIDSVDYVKYYVFYNDGTFVKDIQESLLKHIKQESIQEYLYRIEVDSTLSYPYYRGASWGYYYFQHDSIFLQNITGRPYGGGYWFAYQDIYKVVENGKLKRLESKEIHPGHKWDKSYETRMNSNPLLKYHELIFVDSCNCHESDTWLKYEKWFWKNEQDYLDWIERNGGNKRKYHY